MKNFLSTIGALSLFAIIMLIASSYTGRPLFGTLPNQDNTGRQLTYGATTIADTIGATPDTILIVPENYDKYYSLTLSDSAVIAIKTTKSSFSYSHLHFVITATSTAAAPWVKFIGYSGLTSQWLPNVSATSKYAVTASRTATISFVCTGTKYAEQYRSQD